jgi:ABC-2 type transport system ATP-binding protein
MISAVNLSRWYGDVIAVNDMNLELAPGVTGLLGPNGSGKTTLLKMCVGLLRPSAGQLTVLGEVPWDNPGLLARIGYVPEAPAPWRELTGTQCLLRSGRLYGLVHDGDAALEERVARALAKVGLTDAAERTVNTYSHGMQQRLKFALATLHEPELLILDEPSRGATSCA